VEISQFGPAPVNDSFGLERFLEMGRLSKRYFPLEVKVESQLLRMLWVPPSLGSLRGSRIAKFLVLTDEVMLALMISLGLEHLWCNKEKYPE
jgi:hypothetical protein